MNGVDVDTLTAVHEYVGSGAALGADQQTRTIRITKILPNTPASRAGLTAGLIVQKIDDIPTVGKSNESCASLIRGEAGTTVRLELVNPERLETNRVALTRQKFLMGI